MPDRERIGLLRGYLDSQNVKTMETGGSQL